MEEWVYTVCGYVYEEENALKKRLQCSVSVSKFREQAPEGVTWAYEHRVGVAQGLPEDIMMDLRANSKDECSEVSMYLVISGATHREGCPEIGMHWAKAALEKTEHAVKFAGLLGEVVTSPIKKNLETRAAAENGATADEFDLAKRVKVPDLDVIHDTAHEMTKDEARHGKVFEDLLNRCFG